ncbi:hypothetical protein [Nocardiopsis sp. JB363]|uniref:hypothetical protein n=1 Tax=Nocardiopsis sp. JB363 TaxID=1434837 RepID=UPI00097AFC1B|nr:hypothetical protein [Nocardiopsis sp. JB363]SIO89651.1 hypothetical protein BQ8420_22680 [Nocardiopsis sp. JB363]
MRHPCGVLQGGTVGFVHQCWAAAEQVKGDQAAPVRTLLSQHISADAGFRSAVADLVHPALLRLQFQDEED